MAVAHETITQRNTGRSGDFMVLSTVKENVARSKTYARTRARTGSWRISPAAQLAPRPPRNRRNSSQSGLLRSRRCWS